MVRIASVVCLLVLFAGLVFAQSPDDFVKVDKDGVTYFRVAPSGAATHTATDNTGPALTVTQNGTGPAAAFNGGKVGIGTTTPAQKLHIYGTADLGNAIHIDAQGVTGAQQASLNFLTKGDGATGLQQATTKGWHLTARGDAWATTADRNDISLSFWDGLNWKTPMHIDSINGYVGVGTTSPSQPLDLSGNMAISGVGRRIIADFSNATHANRFAFQTSTANSHTLASVIPSGTGTIAGWTCYSTSNPDDASFFQMRVTEGATCAIDSRKTGTRQILPIVFQMGGAEKMRLTTDGMVGIGTPSPSAMLDVNDTIQASNNGGKVQIYNTNATTGTLNALTDVDVRTGGVARITVKNSGNVGIGTQTPGTSLVVANAGALPSGTGNEYGLYITPQAPGGVTSIDSITSSTSAASMQFRTYNSGVYSMPLHLGYEGNVGLGKVPVSGRQLDLSTDEAWKLSTTAWSVPSDARLKKEIKPFSDGLKTIEGINPVWYKFNGLAGTPDNGKDHIGVVAQEIAKVAPYTVSATKTKLNETDAEPTELLSFNSHALTFVLVNAVKELDVKNKDLRKENDELKKKVDDFDARLKAIEDKLAK